MVSHVYIRMTNETFTFTKMCGVSATDYRLPTTDSPEPGAKRRVRIRISAPSENLSGFRCRFA
jgi:hypothetical protein